MFLPSLSNMLLVFMVLAWDSLRSMGSLALSYLRALPLTTHQGLFSPGPEQTSSLIGQPTRLDRAKLRFDRPTSQLDRVRGTPPPCIPHVPYGRRFG